MRIKKRMMNKIILSGDTVQIELIDGEENTIGTWIVEHDEDDINDPDDLIETQEFIQYG